MKIHTPHKYCPYCHGEMDLHDVTVSEVYGNVRVIYRCARCNQRMSSNASETGGVLVVKQDAWRQQALLEPKDKES